MARVDWALRQADHAREPRGEELRAGLLQEVTVEHWVQLGESKQRGGDGLRDEQV